MSETGGSRTEEREAAVSSVARAIADSLSLKEVWTRVADACRAFVPFDGMGASHLESGDRLRGLVWSIVPEMDDLQDRIIPLTDLSPRLRPGEEIILVQDTERELDRAFPADRDLLARGIRSILRLPLRSGGKILGSLILVSFQPNQFTEIDGRSLYLVAELVSVALGHDRIWREERERHRRHDALQALLPALAQALDIRAIFAELSRITQDVIPHDYVSLGLFNADRSAIRIHATSEDMGKLPEFRFSDDVLLRAFEADFFISRDIEVVPPDTIRVHALGPDPGGPPVIETRPGADWVEVYRKTGVRSQARVPVRLHGKVVGGLTFHSRAKDLYTQMEVQLAVRVADHVALAMAHQELAEEARRSAAAKERASQLERRVEALVEELDARNPHRALGRSRTWRDVLGQATKVAPTETTVLLTGESGTGKEVVARLIHRASARKEGRFVALNCAALPEHLLESELFGHERGAFTGALTARAGKIEQASRGVLFLDEVGEMSLAMQAKFLRVLQEREYERLGGTKPMRADVRVLAATNRDLKRAIANGTFREDLYYRLAVFEIPLPALRERTEDILLLVDAFLEELGGSVGRPAAGVSEEVRDRLVAYPWPGNVRELRNAIERAVILCEGGLITSEHLPIGILSDSKPLPALPTAAVSPAPPTSLADTEREMILNALTRAGYNKSKAARILGLTRAQLRSRIEKHGIPDAG
jgi:transcriptional regulator with GAF, ATPase, and Fis domain